MRHFFICQSFQKKTSIFATFDRTGVLKGHTDMSIELSVKVLAMLTLVPCIAYALWVDHLRRSKADPKDLLKPLRRAGTMVIFSELLIFSAANIIGNLSLTVCIFFLMLALLFQKQIEFGMERKIRSIQATQLEQLHLMVRSFLWALLGGALYSLMVAAFLMGGFLLIQAFPIAPETKMLFLILTCVTGIIAGISVTYGLSAFFIQKMLPNREITDLKLHSLLKNCFETAGLPTPKLKTMELDRFQFNSAMMAGFASGRGWFKPILLISDSILKNFTTKEIQAIILHEISHLRLHHMQKRFIFASAIVLIFGISAAMSTFFFSSLIPPFMTSVVLLLTAVQALHHQNRKHEQEADKNAVKVLQADFHALESALRKLDQMNHLSEKKSILRYLLPNTSHPSTQQRILFLKKDIELA